MESGKVPKSRRGVAKLLEGERNFQGNSMLETKMCGIE
jgi:hypothetical protein